MIMHRAKAIRPALAVLIVFGFLCPSHGSLDDMNDHVRFVEELIKAGFLKYAEKYVSATPLTTKAKAAANAHILLGKGLEDEALEAAADTGNPRFVHTIRIRAADRLSAQRRTEAVNKANALYAAYFDGHPEPPDETWHALYSRAWLCESLLALAQGRVEDAEAMARDAVRYDATHREAHALLQRIREFRSGS